MQRFVMLFAVGALASSLFVAPALGAPAKSGEVIEVDCGGQTVEILVQFNSSGAAVFDGTLQSKGRLYVLSSLEGRAYVGEHVVEPAGPADFAFSKQWGKRNGYSTQLACSAGPFVFADPQGTFTVFFDVVLAGK